MNEDRWMACEDPTPMLEFMSGKVEDRKLRLFSIACVRRHWALLKLPECRASVDLAERYADLPFSPLTFSQPFYRATGGDTEEQRRADAIAWQAATVEHLRTSGVIWIVEEAARIATDANIEKAAQAGLFRCVIGRPLGSAALLPEWRTSTVLALTKQMYESREFSSMPILADALQDAGCTDEAILAHCRGARSHVRGCWIVDLVLGKE